MEIRIKFSVVEKIFILFLIKIIYTNSDSITYYGSKFPISLTLHDDNILLITSDKIIFYDSSLSTILNSYNLSESEITSTLDETYKTMAFQYSQEDNSYILVLIKDQLRFFDKDRNQIHHENFTEEFGNLDYYEIIPIKKINNDLYYIIYLTINKSPSSINLLYYKLDINIKNNSLIYNKTYTPLNVNRNFFCLLSENAICQLMNSHEIKNILTCVYSARDPCKILVTSFSLENNHITELDTYSNQTNFNDNDYINYLKAKTNDDKSKLYIIFTIYEKFGYSIIYDINTNEFFPYEKRVNNKIGSGKRSINMFYFERTEQYVLFFRDNNIELRIVLMNKTFDPIYNEEGKVNFVYKNIYSDSPRRETIIYLKNMEKYIILSDPELSSEFENIKLFDINVTSKIINNYTKYVEESSQEYLNLTYIHYEEEEIENNVEEEEIKNKALEEEIKNNIEEEIKNNVEKEEIKNNFEEEKVNEYEKEITGEEINDLLIEQNEEEKESIEMEISNKEKENHSEEEINIIINDDKNNKCFSYTEESKKMNLCVKCNKGYYPVDFKNNFYPKKYKECFNNNSKLINFYFNYEKEQYEPCFETCNTCNYGGNEDINNCTSCDIDSIFRPEINNTTNCVKKCKYKYYYTEYGQYKCTPSIQCPQEANLVIREKNKCTKECRLDNIYKNNYNGECLKSCPNGTIEENNICININKTKCTVAKNENFLKNNISNEEIDLLVQNYAKEYKNINNVISIYKNEFYSIIIYKNKNCINELSLKLPKVDFGSCYEKIRSNFINIDLIILLYEIYINGSSIVLYNFYNSNIGEKIDVSKECKNENITIEKDITSLIKESKSDKNIQDIIKLTKQNINVFDISNEFYNNICFNYESPNGKDIPLKDRLKEFYPNITVCDYGCIYSGVNLDSMSSICQCKFTDFLGGNRITENAFISKAANEIGEIFMQSNYKILICYEDVFTYKYFIINTGGFIILSLIFFQTICVLIFYFISFERITRYIYILMGTYLSYLNKGKILEDKNNISQFLKDVLSPVKKGLNIKKVSNSKKNHNKKNKKNFIYKNSTNFINVHIKKIEIKNNNSKDFNNISLNSKLKSSKLNLLKNSNKINKDLSNLNAKSSEKNSKNQAINKKNRKILKCDKNHEKNEMRHKLKKFIEEYLSTDMDELDYDDAITLDKRHFCEYFWEKLKYSQFLLDILLINEPIKPRAIKIILVLINIDLYFLINSLFMNEDYISAVYHSNDSSFFSFIKRTNNNLFYISLIDVTLRYLISCFFIEEKKIKSIFKREKDNNFNIKKEILLIIKRIKSGYISFIIISYFIYIFSWYCISCFNNVYRYTKKEWIYSSITIFLAIQILYMIFSFIETIIRFLSFKMKSEKLFKISKIFN